MLFNRSVSVPFLVASCVLLAASTARAQMCEPSPDAFGCVPVACSTIPEDQCIPTVLHLDIHTGAITAVACECMNMNFCHIEFGDASPFAVGSCPDGSACSVAGSDTDGDGIVDRFTAQCGYAPFGACCFDIDDGPVPYDTCKTLDQWSCHGKGGIFDPVNTGCELVEACCLNFSGTPGLCVDLNPSCCIFSGGVPLGPRLRCSDIAECGQICGGIAGIPCEDPAEFCRLPDGHCCCDFMGICTPMPNGCPDFGEPACGCDGVTYVSECDAYMVGVSIDHRGPCERPCGYLAPDPQCLPGEFCKYPVGVCDDVTVLGVCMPIPPGCPDVWDPVCGCDGITYSNECEADMAGVPIAHPGECDTATGPDLIVADVQSVQSYGAEGDISAFSIGTVACNVGDQRVSWVAHTNEHPVIGQNMYRLSEGRFEQIGMSWLIHGFYAVSQSACSPCEDLTDGSELGVGCSTPHSAELNGVQANMGPRSDVNAHTGDFPYPPTVSDPQCGACGLMARRLQVHNADLDPTLNPEASYFVEGHYVAADDAAAGNGNDNVSYRRVAISGPHDSGALYQADVSGTVEPRRPAVRAWRDHDPTVFETEVQVPGDGLLILAAKATELDNGLWRYEYALQNVNSHRSCGSFTVPLPAQGVIGVIGFHDVDYHSGEPFDGSDWESTISSDGIAWATSGYEVNPNANALRWGTLYNFRFDTDAPPQQLDARIGLFRPGSPASVQVPTLGPSSNVCVPSDDGTGCVPLACSPIPEEQCLITAIGTADPNGSLKAVDCECLDLQLCHIEFVFGGPVKPVGGCPGGGTCEIVGHDTDGDGVDDLFTAECLPAETGACCADMGGIPTPWPVCVETTPDGCYGAGMFFEGVGTTCDAVSEACCLPWGYCVQVGPECCTGYGGVSQGPGSRCESLPDRCGPACGGISGIPCDDPDSFCKFPEGTCGHADILGVCTPMEGCMITLWDPVCGCDGVTYGLHCLADAAGVSVAHRGECAVGACCLPDPAGILGCFEGTERECHERGGAYQGDGTTCPTDPNVPCGSPCPQACPTNLPCFSGCGVLVKGAECILFEADAGGLYELENLGNYAVGDRVFVAGCLEPGCVDFCMQGDGCITHNIIGPCPPQVCGGFAGIPCEDPETFCKYPEGTCGDADLFGLCIPRPSGCPRLWDPVCGCDGVTYPNECEADRAGVSVRHRGECEMACASNEDCPTLDLYCQFPEGACGIDPAVVGVCARRPDACPDIWEPVCGCDGITYANACEAARAGMNVDYPGECAGASCWSNTDCEPDSYCFFHVCAAETGVCTPRPGWCPDVWDPVCGCDGVTYPNACEAARAGMSVDYPGVCQGAYCWSNEDCGPDAYCFFHVCAVETGVCAPRPGECPDVWDPVCGCDGVTYPNACEAARAGMSVDYPGECVTACFGDDDCPAANLFCKFPEGTCGKDPSAPGTCTPRPDACPEIWDPVCGCDGRTYGNECEADAAGVSVRYRGECERLCYAWGTPDFACHSDEFCRFPEGTCGMPGIPGVCTLIPTDCPAVWLPVCGCDGRTYGNECEAAAAGVSVRHQGECEIRCTADSDCPAVNQFCKFPEGTCGDASIPGLCTPRPEGCPDVWDPVCGCDGLTYGNECEADAAGVSILHRGECEQPQCPATRALLSTGASFCPGTPSRVQIHLNPQAGMTAMALEDAPPAGWIVSNISSDGTFDAAHGKVKWGPFFMPDLPRSVSYDVTPLAATADPACFFGTVSVDGINYTICGDECVEPSCCPRMPADSPQPECLMCRAGDCTTCTNGACLDGQISMCELIGYACAWMKGCNDDLAGVTRAAFVWRRGECYCWHDGEQNWFPTDCPPPASGCCNAMSPDGGGVDAAASAVATARVEAVRGGKATMRVEEISVSVDAPAGTLAMALEVIVPKGWKVRTISDDGQWDERHGKVKWGPFFENLSRTVSFTVRHAADAAPARAGRLSRARNVKRFTGTVSFDGVNFPVEIR